MRAEFGRVAAVMKMGLLVAMYVESGGNDSYICIHMFF